MEKYLYGRDKSAAEVRHDVAAEIPAATDHGQNHHSRLLENLEGPGDYVTNLKICLRAPFVKARHMGIVTSAVAAYEKMIGERVRKESQGQTRAESRYAGTVGEKLTVTGTVATLVPVETDYGTSMLVVVEAGATVAKMFTTAAWAWEVKQGEEITLSAKVKDHEEYKGVKQKVG